MSIAVRDPVRLVADPACPESERALLRLGADIVPPGGAEARVWLAVVAAIGLPAAAGAGAGAAETAAGTATKLPAGAAGGVKIATVVTAVVALAVLAAVVALGSRLILTGAPAPGAPAIVPVAPAVVPPVPPPAAATTPPDDADPPRPQPAAHRPVRDGLRPRTAASAAPAPSPAARLREETTLIRDARQALRAGDAARALRVLDDCRRLFPSGVLVQERERLVIEALMKDGRAADAASRAAAFLRRYPDSPHAAEIRALAPETSGSAR